MPRNSSTGSYSAPASTVNPAVAGTVISETDFNALLADIATALAHTDSTTRALYPSTGQFQDAGPLWAGTTAGTSTAYTASLTPAITAYVAGMRFFVDVHTACGAAPTINLNSLGAKNIKLVSGAAPGAGAIQAGPHIAHYDGTNVYLAPLGASGPATVYSAASSGVAQIDILLPSGFSFFKFHGFLQPSVDQTFLLLRTSIDGGANFAAGATDYEYMATVTTSGIAIGTSTAQSTAILLSPSLDNAATSNGVVDGTIYPGDGTIYPRISAGIGCAADGGAGLFQGLGWHTGVRRSAARINAIRLLASGGNLTGHLTVLGYR